MSKRYLKSFFLFMENHPIPQDVTGFQFKLVGNMTIKQFGYVALGVVMAVVLYYLPIQSAFGVLIKTICIPLFGISGFLIAFLPVEGRPIDVMIGNFIRALVTPNQYVYHKTGRLFEFSNLPTAKQTVAKKPATAPSAANADKARQLSQLLLTKHAQKQTKLDEKETAFLRALSLGPTNTSPSLQLQTQPIVSEPTPSVLPSAPQQEKPNLSPSDQRQTQPQTQPQTITNQPTAQTSTSLAEAEDLLNKQLQQAKKDEQSQQTTGAADAAHQKVTLLERQVQALHFQRQQLEQQLLHLQKQLAHQQQGVPQTPTPSAATPTPMQTTTGGQQPQAQKSSQSLSKNGLPHIPDTPNVIVGLVKDPRGNVLPNILVEVKDKDGNPVRAFKTNALGQFASATPLSPGNYTVELEDPKKQNRFDVIQLAATNQILLPIEIVSHDAREELRKQLFN